jgi:hypothetical protein
MKVAHLSLALQMPSAWCSCRQNDEATSPEMSLTPDELFLKSRGGTKIDDKNMTVNGRQSKIIEGMHNLRDVNPLPVFSSARLDDMLRWNVKRGFWDTTLQCGMIHCSHSLLMLMEKADLD